MGDPAGHPNNAEDDQCSDNAAASPSTPSIRSTYKLPVAPLISRNLSYVFSLPTLPSLSDIHHLLISSTPSISNQYDPVGHPIQERIASLTSTSERREALIELRQALALSLSSPADQHAGGGGGGGVGSSDAKAKDRESTSTSTTGWSTLEETLSHRLLLASCYILSSPPRLHEAIYELQVARSFLRSWVSSSSTSLSSSSFSSSSANPATAVAVPSKEGRRERIAISRSWSMQLLLASANVLQLQGGSLDEVKRLMTWRDKARGDTNVDDGGMI